MKNFALPNTMKFKLMIIIAVLFQLDAGAQYCTGDLRFTQTPVFTDAQIGYDTAVVYGNALNYQGVNQDLLLNICYPKSSVDTFSKRPLIILMHGGGFLVGNRNNLNTMCIEFSKRGFVAATIGYRLGWDSGTVNCGGDTSSNALAVYRGFQDAHAALRYLVANAAVYKIDTAWIFCGGESAGGVNSLNLAFTSQSEMNGRLSFLQAELGDINNSGNSLHNTFSLKGLFINWASIVEIDFINSSDAIPMIAFQGDADDCLPIDSGRYSNCPNYIKMYGSRTIYNRLISLGVCSELTVKQGGDHGVYDETQASNIFRVGRACCFFKSLFCNSCSSNYLTDSIFPDCSSLSSITESNFDDPVFYPNPTDGKFKLSSGSANETVKMINVYNIMGEKVYSVNNYSKMETFDIDISGHVKGIYLISICYDRRCLTKKIVIQ